MMDPSQQDKRMKDLLYDLFSSGNSPENAYSVMMIGYGENTFSRETCQMYFDQFQKETLNLKRHLKNEHKLVQPTKVPKFDGVENLVGNIVGNSVDYAITEAAHINRLGTSVQGLSINSLITPAHNLNRVGMPNHQHHNRNNSKRRRLNTGYNENTKLPLTDVDFINALANSFQQEYFKLKNKGRTDEPSVSIMPTMILDNVVDFFVESAELQTALQLFIYISPDTIEIVAKNLKNVFIKFEKLPNGRCEVSQPFQCEIHQSDFVDLSINTLLRILRSPKWSDRCLGVNRAVAPLKIGLPVWLRFSKTVYSLRQAFAQINISKFYYIFNSMEEYHALVKHGINFSIAESFCAFDSRPDDAEEVEVQNAEEYAREHNTKLRRMLLDVKFV